MEDYFKIGIITSSHGVRGEMKVYPTTDDPRRFKACKEVFIEDKNGDLKTYKVESARMSTDKVLLKVEGIDTPEDAVKYRQRGVFVDREHAVKLSEDEYFIADLIGIGIKNEDGEDIGTLKDVIQTGANDVYQIDLNDGRELLLPAIKDCVLEVNVRQNYIVVHILDGLL